MELRCYWIEGLTATAYKEQLLTLGLWRLSQNIGKKICACFPNMHLKTSIGKRFEKLIDLGNLCLNVEV